MIVCDCTTPVHDCSTCAFAGEDPDRRDLVVKAVVEAARHLMAVQLVHERGLVRGTDDAGEVVAAFDWDDALQTLRDALYAERRTR